MTHRWLESKLGWMALFTTIVIMIGTVVELVPLYLVESTVPIIPDVKPYTALELEGRDLYIREGCYNCHSQAVRPFRDETERYGPYSKPGEYIYDRPFQWGSKRTVPDLHRVGGKYPDSWHYIHMKDPRELVPESTMPAYPWMLTSKLDTRHTQKKMEALVLVGTPYSPEEIEKAHEAMAAQAEEIVGRLKQEGIEDPDAESEIVALIAYLQRLGSDIRWREL